VPFLIENQLQSIEGAAMGTMMAVADQHILIIQSALTEDELKQDAASTPYDKKIIVGEIPRDARHSSKIDYEELRWMLKSK